MGSQGVPLEKFVLVIPSTPEQFAAQSPSASVAESCSCGGLREPDNLALSAAPASRAHAQLGESRPDQAVFSGNRLNACRSRMNAVRSRFIGDRSRFIRCRSRMIEGRNRMND